MKPPLVRNSVTSMVLVVTATLSGVLVTSCSRGAETAETTGPPPTTTTQPGSPSPTAAATPTPAPVPATVNSPPPTSAFVEATVAPGSSTPSDGNVTYTVTSGTNVLEVQESPEKTTFVVSDPNQNVVYFEIFDNSDPALNDLFETPEGGGAADTELVLRDEAGVEVARVRLVDLAAARIAVEQSP